MNNRTFHKVLCIIFLSLYFCILYMVHICKIKLAKYVSVFEQDWKFSSENEDFTE